ncbi:MAG: lysine exporter LysO family protein [Thermovenabulum sp.]|uniref:lysine exporter LysO family protein n=1 Tax=Thermovenabulum sp. TaxID=3100335 RepID=UPI003C7E613F
MSRMIMIAVVSGMISGLLFNKFIFFTNLDLIITLLLLILIFFIGYDLSKKKDIIFKIKEKGLNLLIIPFVIGIGSIIGASIGGIFLKMPISEAAAVGAGCGWYSMSGVLLSQIKGPELGTIAFLANVLRELTAFLFLPYFKKISKLAPIGVCGATAMDTTLPLISRVLGLDYTVIALISGFILTMIVPVILPIVVKFPF